MMSLGCRQLSESVVTPSSGGSRTLGEFTQPRRRHLTHPRRGDEGLELGCREARPAIIHAAHHSDGESGTRPMGRGRRTPPACRGPKVGSTDRGNRLWHDPSGSFWTPLAWRRFAARGRPKFGRSSSACRYLGETRGRARCPHAPPVRPAPSSVLRSSSSSSFFGCAGFRAGDVATSCGWRMGLLGHRHVAPQEGPPPRPSGRSARGRVRPSCRSSPTFSRRLVRDHCGRNRLWSARWRRRSRPFNRDRSAAGVTERRDGRVRPASRGSPT